MANIDVPSPARTTSALIIVGVGWTWFYNGANFLAFKVGDDAFHPLMLGSGAQRNGKPR